MSVAERVHVAWNTIHSWFAKHAPQKLEASGPPATDDEVKAAETELGRSLPEDLKAFYTLHNGIATDVFPSCVGFDSMGFTPLSLEQIVEEWRLWKDNSDAGEFADSKAKAKPGIRPEWWNDAWVPFASNGGGDCQCVDLAPAQGGSIGQVISIWHDMDERRLLAPSFVEFLEQIARGLESGRYKFKPGYGPVAIDE
jgi:cell wall assembly regulator SMI1